MRKAYLNISLGFAASLMITSCGLNGTKPLDSISHANQGAYEAKLSAGGKHTIVASINHGGSFWNVKQKERLFSWNHSDGQFTTLSAVALSSNGKVALTADGNRLVAWDASTGASIGFWNTPAEILSLALSGDGKFALAGLRNYTAVYIEIATGSIINTLSHNDNVRAVAITYDGGLGLTGSDDSTAKLWVLQEGKAIRTWKHELAVNTVALSADGKKAFTASQAEKAFVREPEEDKTLLVITSRSNAYEAARFSADGSRLLLGTTNRSVLLWDITAKKRTKRWTAPKKSLWKPRSVVIYDVAFGQGDTVYAATSDGITYSWN